MPLSPETCVIIVLAAGQSSRMGQPKQLLSYKNKSLLVHAVDEAIKATDKLVIVVSGANKSPVEAELEDLPIQLVYNAKWQEGMASSIRQGLEKLRENFPLAGRVIFTACDQPFISAGLFGDLMKKKDESGKGIVACAYKNTLGIPVLFDKKYFNDLFNLTGQQGAKKLLDLFADDIVQVQFPEGSIDIDTAEDYKNLLDFDKT